MSDTELQDRLRRMERRLAELEAANGLRALAPASEDEQTLGAVCQIVGIGIRTIQGEARDAEACRKRAVVARVLRRKMGWSEERTARALRKTTRAVRNWVRG